ncbi:methyltransferase domain-containing protein [Psychroserpens burtonensis]|uniref:Methyltransferase domain-containing protein n=1 Tax=Psychroserpens burtonensis TaxID=49278 RepID=A0A5C7BIJ2_9FLAO|nr:methyltransferase domain-containing protein [Psychroserpens burtonensis]TXE19659.1 methyltransferase domain-containing protein [Psychroserpens burtonensis]
MDSFDESYWDNRYKQHTDAWGLGKVSPPIKAYFDQIEDKSLRILIPGGGNSYEAEYLFNNGFQNVYVVDLSQTALQNIKARVPNFSDPQLLHANFFDLEMTFDIIIEQTFFCALNPSLRTDYVQKMHELLGNNGILVGLLFNQPLNKDNPPFGGHKALYVHFFDSLFNIQIIEDCYNSIASRMGDELFFKFLKK